MTVGGQLTVFCIGARCRNGEGNAQEEGAWGPHRETERWGEKALGPLAEVQPPEPNGDEGSAKSWSLLGILERKGAGWQSDLEDDWWRLEDGRTHSYEAGVG